MTTTRTISRKTRQIRPGGPGKFPFSKADGLQVSERLGEPDWLAGRRQQAWKTWESLPLPTLKDEPWRRTDLRNLSAERMVAGPAADAKVDPRLLEPMAAETHGALMVLQPGKAAVVEGLETFKEQGVVFADWPTAVREHGELLEKHLGAVVVADEGKFAALAAAMAGDGVLVYVPQGVEVREPLHSVLWAPGVGTAFFSRVLVVVEDGASLTYVHETASTTDPSGEAMDVGIVEVLVGENAHLTFVELQNWGEHVWNFTHERSRVGRDGKLNWIFGAVGSRLTKSFMDLSLDGQGAEGRMSGFYITSGVQHFDYDTQQNHMAPNTTSDLLFKGALIDRSRSVWQGMIYVAPGAQKTDGYQANRNLILSKRARADSIPGLEILADDVRCTHGATVSQLEEEPVFYLMSRGLPRAEAERLVIDGFFAPIMNRIPFEGVRNRFQGMIDEKMKVRF